MPGRKLTRQLSLREGTAEEEEPAAAGPTVIAIAVAVAIFLEEEVSLGRFAEASSICLGGRSG